MRLGDSALNQFIAVDRVRSRSWHDRRCATVRLFIGAGVGYTLVPFDPLPSCPLKLYPHAVAISRSLKALYKEYSQLGSALADESRDAVAAWLRRGIFYDRVAVSAGPIYLTVNTGALILEQQ
jgi:hypothetical protein